MIRVGRALLLTFGFALAAPSHAADNTVTLHELDMLSQLLAQGRAVTRQDILGIFRVRGTGVRVDQGLEYRDFAQPGIEQLIVGTLENSDAILRLDVVLDSNTCVNAKGVIKRYDLKDSSPPDPNPYAHAVSFAHEYGDLKYITSGLEVIIPVHPALIPLSQLTDTSCISEIMVMVYPHPQQRSEIKVL